MKTFFFLIAFCIVSVQIIATNRDLKGHPEKYCAKTKDGKLVIMHHDTELKEETTLADGSKIKVDGTVVKKDGSTVKLKAGECIDKEGKIMEEKTKDKVKKEKS